MIGRVWWSSSHRNPATAGAISENLVNLARTSRRRVSSTSPKPRALNICGTRQMSAMRGEVDTFANVAAMLGAGKEL